MTTVIILVVALTSIVLANIYLLKTKNFKAKHRWSLLETTNTSEISQIIADCDREYTQQLLTAQLFSTYALAQAAVELEKLQIQTSDLQFYFFIIPTATLDSSNAVGTVHYNLDLHQSAFIEYIFVKPEFRGHGAASQALLALENHARSQGAQRIKLFVFDHNQSAYRLYLKLGYQEVDRSAYHNKIIGYYLQKNL